MTDRVLNLGCGTDTYGTHFLDLYAARPDVLAWDVEKGLPYPPEFFDEVYSKNLLEHVSNPGLLLAECYRILRKRGKLRLITDNAGYWRFYLPYGGHTGGYELLHGRGQADRHYAVFTMHHIRNLLRRSGFAVQRLEYVYYQESPYVKKLDRLLRCFNRTKHLAYPRIYAEAVKL